MSAKKTSILLAGVGALFTAGMVAAQEWETTLGVGTDLSAEAHCLSCHVPIKDRWDLPSTHKLNLDCTICHTSTAASGPGHSTARACSDCHSEKSHPAADAACTSCHDPHGSSNAFLVRGLIASKAVVLAKPEGRSQNGLAHGDGTGACEVCHSGTTFYNSSGTGQPHETGWCIKCHSHQESFLKPAE